MKKSQINARRLLSTIEEMATIGPGVSGGCNRQALTDDDKRGRDLFVSWCRDAGCDVAIDEVGNIFARRKGRQTDLPPVITGSHLDTQETGGRFDGVYGVLAGLEVVRSLNDLGLETERPIEIVCWTNEEGCRFAPAMLGSGVVSGAYEVEFAYSRVDKDGTRFADELDRIGYRGLTPARKRPVAAFIEAHIEQGPILESEGVTIGAVSGIQGAYWIDITLTGQSCHAGPTPMDARRDPWRAAAPIIQRAFEIAYQNSPWGRATVGEIKLFPGSRNTVPERITLSVDIRHPERDILALMLSALKETVREACETHQINEQMEIVWHMPATKFDEGLVKSIEDSAASLGLSHKRMVSGAGHDSLHTARFAPTAMIFIPCADGLSHNEAENATEADLAAGTAVLFETILKTANS